MIIKKEWVVPHLMLFNRKERKETLRPLGILWELCGKKI
jgi:hypothetical protein